MLATGVGRALKHIELRTKNPSFFVALRRRQQPHRVHPDASAAIPGKEQKQNKTKTKQNKQTIRKKIQRVPQDTRHAPHKRNSFSHPHPCLFLSFASPFLDMEIDVPSHLFLHRRRDPVWTMDLLLTKGAASEIPARYRCGIITRDHRVRPPPPSVRFHRGVNHLCRRSGSNSGK